MWGNKAQSPGLLLHTLLLSLTEHPMIKWDFHITNVTHNPVAQQNEHLKPSQI